MEIAPLQLARIQFVASLGFHMLFLSIALALAWMLLFFKWRARRGDAGWMAAYRFWVRIFALAFVLALASGVAVLFQIGSLWPVLMERIGNIAGPLIGFAVATVFVLKSCFLGVMLFGQRRVSDAAHTLSVLMVAAGMLLALFWVVALQSWTHTPAGAALVDGRYQVADWWAVVFNPSLPWRFGMAALSAVLAVAFLMLGVTAWQARYRPAAPGEKAAFRTALVAAAAAIVLQGAVGQGLAGNVAGHQPAAAAAAAGYWHSGAPPRTVLFGWPDAAEQRNLLEWSVPGGPYWLGRAADGSPLGMDEFSGMLPPVPAVFWLLRTVLALGALMLLVSVATLAWPGRRGLDPDALPRGWLRVISAMTFSGCIAVVAGWWMAELAREPYAVYGTVTLSEVAGTATFGQLAWGLAGYGALYALLLAAFVQMLFHAARYGVVPVRKGGARP